MGVAIISGTAAAMSYVVHGENAHELAMLVEAGLTTTEALVAATGGAVSIAHPEVGLIAPGCYADFVLVAGDPLADSAIL